MHRLITLLAISVPSAVLAEAFERPIPQPQSATAEWWFLGASIALLVALLAVHLLVRRR